VFVDLTGADPKDVLMELIVELIGSKLFDRKVLVERVTLYIWIAEGELNESDRDWRREWDSLNAHPRMFS